MKFSTYIIVVSVIILLFAGLDIAVNINNIEYEPVNSDTEELTEQYRAGGLPDRYSTDPEVRAEDILRNFAGKNKILEEEEIIRWLNGDTDKFRETMRLYDAGNDGTLKKSELVHIFSHDFESYNREF